MTTDDVVARAIELCKKEIQETKDFYGGKGIWGLTEMTCWQTHLDEFEDHEGEDYRSQEKMLCKSCEDTRRFIYYPCDVIKLKAKRLLGEEL